MLQLQALSFEEFQKLLADLLQLDVAPLKPDAYFVADLGVDSFRLVEAMLRLEELGLPLSLDAAWQIETVGDSYRYYQEQAGQSLTPRPSP